MKKLVALYTAIMMIILSAAIGCSAPTPVPGKSHFSMARVLHDDSVSIKAGEAKSLDVTLETRKQGPGEITYKILGIAEDYGEDNLPLPAGLDVSIEPSKFMAYPNSTYHSTITVNNPPASWGASVARILATFAARIRFAAPKDAACHPTLRFIPAASCGVFSLDFYKNNPRTSFG